MPAKKGGFRSPKGVNKPGMPGMGARPGNMAPPMPMGGSPPMAGGMPPKPGMMGMKKGGAVKKPKKK